MQARTGYPHIATETLNHSSFFRGYGIDAGINGTNNEQRQKQKPQRAMKAKLTAKLFSDLFEYLLEILYAASTSTRRSLPVHWTHCITSFVNVCSSGNNGYRFHQKAEPNPELNPTPYCPY
jgi:hypothetical protein